MNIIRLGTLIFRRTIIYSILLFTMTAHAANTYTEPDFSDAVPVRLEIVQGTGTLGARFVRPSSRGIEIEMLDGVGSIMVDWDHMDQFTINIPMTEELNIALSHPDPKQKVALLEQQVWPLLPLASIRADSTNIHILINAYVEAVIAADDWLRGFEMSQYMALNRSPQETVKHFYTVAENLFVIGEKEKSLKLIDQLFAARPEEESRKLGLKIANRLLELRLFQPAYRLYSLIAEGGSPLSKKKALLNCGYLALELGELNMADDYLKKAKSIDEEDFETISAEYFVSGVQAFLSGDAMLALNHIGHSMALISVNSHIKQAGLYFSYLCYANLEQPEIAQNILDEMKLLFPDGAYRVALTHQTTGQSSE
jgi:tetratricopeptide (TPR) repeat protein